MTSYWAKTLALTAVMLLGACSWFGDKDEQLEPSPLVDFEPTLEVKRVWSVKIGSGVERAGVMLSPAFYRGRIFAASTDGTMRAIDVDNGRNIWSTKLKLPLSAGPGVAEDIAVVGTLDGEVVALSAESGQELWRAQASSEILATPAIHQGMVVVRSQDGRIFGFDARSGLRRWVFDRSVPLLSLRGNSPPIVGDGLAYVGFDNGRVAAIRVADGALAWEEAVAIPQGRTDLDRMVDVDGRFELFDSDLYAVGYQGRVAALTADSGRLLWVRELSSHAGLAVAREHLFVTDAEDAVWGLERLSGGTLWRQEKLQRRVVGAPVAHGDYVVVGDFEGYLHWLGNDDGAFHARIKVDGDGLAGPPLALGPTLYVLGRSGRLNAYRIG